MSNAVRKDFWGQVVRGSTNSVSFLCIELQSCGKPKISKFYFQWLIKEKVSQFQISVDYFAFV